MFHSSDHHETFRSYPHCKKGVHAKVQGQKSEVMVTEVKTNFAPISMLQTVTLFEFTDDYKMIHKAWSDIEEVPCHLGRSSVECQGHMGKKSTFLSWIECFQTAKWCTKLKVAWRRCSIVLQGHLSNVKVTQAKETIIFTELSISGL